MGQKHGWGGGNRGHHRQTSTFRLTPLSESNTPNAITTTFSSKVNQCPNTERAYANGFNFLTWSYQTSAENGNFPSVGGNVNKALSTP